MEYGGEGRVLSLFEEKKLTRREKKMPKASSFFDDEIEE
jgi:hypothetical protein